MAKQLLEFVVSAILLSNCAWSVASCAGSATEVSCVEGAAALSCAGDAQAGSTGAGNGMEVGTRSGNRSGIDCDSLLGILGYYNRIDESDSVCNIGRRIFYAPVGSVDELTRLCAGIYLAQEFSYTENLDSAEACVARILPQTEMLEGTFLEGMFYAVQASLAIKSERDFSSAVDLLIKSYKAFEDIGDIEKAIIPLGTLVQLCYALNDLQGMDYAEKIYSLAAKTDDPWLKYVAVLSKAQMASLSGDKEAIVYIRQADSLLNAGGYRFHQYMIYLLDAEYLESEGKYAEADSLFAQSLQWAERFSGEPSGIQQVCFEWGKLCEKLEDYPRAIELYRKGLDIAGVSESNALTDKLLLKLSDCFLRMGRSDSSIYYYKRYLKFVDSLQVLERDREKDRLILNYRQAEQRYEAREREMIAGRKIIIMSSCLLIMTLSVIFLIVWMRHQRKTYRTLVDQYRKSLATPENAGTKKEDSGGDGALWAEIEKLMEKDKVFMKNSLTLESLADAAGTNRTYLSRTINKFSGGNFNAYIDRYRVREAVRIIEESSDRMPFKELADKVGYNSLQVFYKAFQRETGLSPGGYRNEVKRRRTRA